MSCNAYTEEPLSVVPHIRLQRVHIDFCL